MFWDKKESDKSLPDLPPLKTNIVTGPKFPAKPAIQPSPEEKYGLPSFPEPMQKGFSQAAIKSAISTEEEIKGASETPKTMEMEEWTPHKLPSPSEPAPAALPRKHEVFVKIDKFHSAKRSLEMAKEKLEDIDALLKKIRETKIKEEQELSSWEKELSSVKARIKHVTENIFEKEE